MLKEVKQAIAKYRKFYGKTPSKTGKVNIPFPRAVVCMGEGVAVEYRSDKKLDGTFKKRVYRHKFGKGVKIYTDPSGATIYVTGGRMRVTDWIRR
jgi:hypothetical protein